MRGRPGRILIISALLIFSVLLTLVAGCGNQETGDLDSTKIAEYNKPGTVLVETIWTADVSFPGLAIDYDALGTYFVNSVLDGTIPADATEEELATALVLELVTYPELYLYATTEDRVTTMEASVYGSGFVVRDDGYVVTNAHVVKKSDEDLAETMAQENAGDLLQDDLAAFENELGIDLPPEYEDYFLEAALNLYATFYTVSSPSSETSVYTVNVGGESISDPMEAEVAEVGDPMNIQDETGKDVAVLKVNQSNMPTVAMGDDKDLMDGNSVWALGYPGTATFDYTLDLQEELAPTLTQGTVSAKKTVSGGWEVIQTDAYTTHGSSGSPLLNSQGEAIAVNTFGAGEVNESTGEFEESPGFNFAIPATVINEFLEKANVDPALGSLTETYRDGIDLFMDKHYSAAKEKFQEVNDANSDFPYVQDYLEQSSAKISAGEDVSTFPIPIWLLIVIIAGAAVVIVVVVLLVIRMAGKGGKQPPAATAAAPGPAAPTPEPPAPAPESAAPPAPEPAAPAPEPEAPAPQPEAPSEEAQTTEMPAAGTAAPEEAPEAAAEHSFCSKCGTKLGEDAEFCSKCGSPVQ